MDKVEDSIGKVTEKITSLKDNKTFKIIIGIILLLFVINLIYRLYRNIKKRIKNAPFLMPGYHNANDALTYTKSLPKSNYGYGFTYNFWMYIIDWGTNFNEPKHVFHVGDSDGNSVCPGIWLYPKKNNLMIRFDTHNRYTNLSETISGRKCQNWKSSYPHDTSEYTENIYPSGDLGNHNYCRNPDNRPQGTWCFTQDPNRKTESCKIENYKTSSTMNPLKDPSLLDIDKECDIVDIAIQRWVQISVVLNNKTVDVYLDGKLRRSCTLENVPKLNSGQVYITQFGGFNGFLANLQYINKPMSARDIYSKYLSGPKREGLLETIRQYLAGLEVEVDCGCD